MPRSKHSQRAVRAAACELVERCRAGHPDLIAKLACDPLATVADWDGITLVMADERQVPDACSVSGSYNYETGRIVVARSASRRRQNFTALHELAHHLQQHDDISVTLLATEPDVGIRLEDDICDAFAAQVLIPEHLVDGHMPEKGPTAQGVIDLFEHSHASREACCVRAAQRILGEGYVMLCDQAGTAIFTATTSQYRLRRNTQQTQNKLIEASLRWGKYSCETRVTFPSGAQSPLMFGNGALDGDYLFAVLVAQRPAWIKGLTPTLPYPNPPIGRPDAP